MLEIEKRGFLTKKKYYELIKFFNKNGRFLGDDDKDVVYYIFNNKLLKAVHNISKKNAKISLKMNKIGDGSVFPEIEVIFNEKDYPKIKFILDKITNPDKIMKGIQKRKNYIYRDCEFAVKWSKDWGYHFEVEKVVENKKVVAGVLREIESIVSELGINIMSEEELKNFTKKAEENANKKL
ncbi:MAG: hypothetical protein ACD_79C00891G0001 [uncultured bacterium]|nr:MAG: hypothetical protein ACD_79C00891G0001 [uncultured bacterium]